MKLMTLKHGVIDRHFLIIKLCQIDLIDLMFQVGTPVPCFALTRNTNSPREQLQLRDLI